jgi:nickel/cobalt transporter (NiCoT) family protein
MTLSSYCPTSSESIAAGRLRYRFRAILTITAVSVVVAVVVGGLEAPNLIGDQRGLTDGGGFWGAIRSPNDNFGMLGYVIVGIFIVAWIVSYAVYRFNGYDKIEVAVM